MKTKIVLSIAIIAILVGGIAAYVGFSSSTAANPTATPSPKPSTTSGSLPNATISVEPTALQLSTANIGQTIEVNVTATNASELWGWDVANLTFNSNVLNLTAAQEGPFMKSVGQTAFLSTASVPSVKEGNLPSVADAFFENTTVSGSGTLMTLKFTVLSAGTSPITLGKVDLYTPIVANAVDWATGTHQAINSTIVNGRVTVAP